MMSLNEKLQGCRRIYKAMTFWWYEKLLDS